MCSGRGAPQRGAPDAIGLFIAASPPDHRWLDRLTVHLRPALRRGEVVLWNADAVGAGDESLKVVAGWLAAARVAIVLLSADYLASEAAHERELPALLAAAENGWLKLIPVIASPCAVPATLARYQTVNPSRRTLARITRAEREEVYAAVARIVEEHVAGLRAGRSRRLEAIT